MLLLASAGFGAYSYFKKEPIVPQSEKIPEKSVEVKFLLEVYGKIQTEYWDKITDEQLSNLYLLAAQKLQNRQFTIINKNSAGVEQLYSEATLGLDEAQKKEFTVNLATVVLANLQPFGRSGLFTSKQEEQLKNTVSNINPEQNLYSDLGLQKGAAPQDVKIAYEKKSQELKKQSSPESKQQLEKIEYANRVLGDENSKQTYDTTGAEPTVFTQQYGSNILHMYIKRFSPTTLDEFVKLSDKADKTQSLNTLVLDMRGNIGGAIDISPYLLGPFIGFNQYAFELWHQATSTPVKTMSGWLPSLVRYKKVVILIDGGSQSTAELMAGVLKKYNVGVVMGAQSKGWGTIERVFELENQINPQKEKYSMFLVHTLTLRDDNQPIEGRGIEPHILMADKNWKKELLLRFNDQTLTQTLERIWNSKLP